MKYQIQRLLIEKLATLSSHNKSEPWDHKHSKSCAKDFGRRLPADGFSIRIKTFFATQCTCTSGWGYY